MQMTTTTNSNEREHFSRVRELVKNFSIFLLQRSLERLAHLLPSHMKFWFDFFLLFFSFRTFSSWTLSSTASEWWLNKWKTRSCREDCARFWFLWEFQAIAVQIATTRKVKKKKKKNNFSLCRRLKLYKNFFFVYSSHLILCRRVKHFLAMKLKKLFLPSPRHRQLVFAGFCSFSSASCGNENENSKSEEHLIIVEMLFRCSD